MDVTNDKDAIQNLELPEGHLQIIQSIVESHFMEQSRDGQAIQDWDVVRGKGTTLNIVMG